MFSKEKPTLFLIGDIGQVNMAHWKYENELAFNISFGEGGGTLEKTNILYIQYIWRMSSPGAMSINLI